MFGFLKKVFFSAFHLQNENAPFHFECSLCMWLNSRQSSWAQCILLFNFFCCSFLIFFNSFFLLKSVYLFSEIRSCLCKIRWSNFNLSSFFCNKIAGVQTFCCSNLLCVCSVCFLSFTSFFYWSFDHPFDYGWMLLLWSNSNDTPDDDDDDISLHCISTHAVCVFSAHNEKMFQRQEPSTKHMLSTETFSFILLYILFPGCTFNGEDFLSYFSVSSLGFPFRRLCFIHWAYNFRFQLHFRSFYSWRKFPLHQTLNAVKFS